jgi:hypothetical protein
VSHFEHNKNGAETYLVFKVGKVGEDFKTQYVTARTQDDWLSMGGHGEFKFDRFNPKKDSIRDVLTLGIHPKENHMFIFVIDAKTVRMLFFVSNCRFFVSSSLRCRRPRISLLTKRAHFTLTDPFHLSPSP